MTTFTETPQLRSGEMLTGPWHFQLDQDNRGIDQGWHTPTFDHNDWPSVSVPGAWDLYDLALWGYEGIGWYTTSISAHLVRPNNWQRLCFTRVGTHARVWLNGYALGEHANAYLPFGFAVTSYLHTDRSNLLVVRVDNTPRLDWLPGGQEIEWVQWGGILQPVWLLTTSPTYISDVTVVATPDGAGAMIRCTIEITNRGTDELHSRVSLHISTSTGTITENVVITCAAGESRRVSISPWLSNVALWSPENPVLHQAYVMLMTGDHLLDVAQERFGVRSVEVQGRDILLNGQKLYIKGVNRYDDYAGYGPTVPETLIRADLTAIKQAGANMVRVHYPHDPLVLQIMDEIGLLLMEEVPLNWWRAKQEDDNDAIIDAAERALEEMVHRDKNHPCLVIWSMANECATDTEVGIQAMRRLMRHARELDPTRLVTFVAAGGVEGHEAFDEADLVAVNLYHGLFRGELAHRLADMEESVYKPTEAQLREIVGNGWEKPIIVTEFGTHGVYGLRGDARFTEDYQAAYIQAVWKAINSVPEVSGGVLWCWADYYHRRNFIGQGERMIHSPFGPYGVVTLDRRAKQALHVFAQMLSSAE